MIRRVIAPALLAASLLASAYAQQKPNFTGTWKLNVAKSDFGMVPGPDSRLDVITHNEPTLTDKVAADTAQGKQDYTAVYTTDGKEAVNKRGPVEAKSILHWDGGKLVMDTKLNVNDQDITIKAVWTLSADGKTLTQNVHLAAAMGETDQTLLYEKQEGGAVSAAPAAAPQAVASVASGKPNYSGTWKLNVGKSDFGPVPGPDTRTQTIEHKEPTLKVANAEEGPMGKQNWEISLVSDGTEVAAKMGDREVKNAVSWEAGNIVVTTKLQYEGSDVVIKATYLLSGDGKVLTVNAHITSPMGEFDQKLIYDKA
jgi:hypothetical protein